MLSSSESDDYIGTSELVRRIEAEFNMRVDVRTVTSWVSRSRDPLPMVFAAKRGQSRRFDWETARAWVARDLVKPLGESDMIRAKTISARERAKRDCIITRKLEESTADVAAFHQANEEMIRKAQAVIREKYGALPPRLVGESELTIYQILDDTVRDICQTMERYALERLAALEVCDEERRHG